MITEKQANAFLDITKNYFYSLNDSETIVRSPYIIKNFDETLEEFSGVITIDGQSHGTIIFTASREILIRILTLKGFFNINEEMLLDCVGEVANVISGNAQKYFGDKFEISTPERVMSKNIKIKESAYAIPLIFDKKKASIIISLDSI